MNLFYKRHDIFFKDNVLKPEVHVEECIKEFLYPFIDKLIQHPKVEQWRFFNVKSSIL